MKTLVFEPDHTGHRFAYVGALLPSLLELGCDVTLVTTEAARGTPELGEHVGPFESRISLDFRPRIELHQPLKTAKAKIGMFRDTLRRHRPEHVYCPSADGLTQLLGAVPWNTIPAGIQTEVCMHRGSFAYPAIDAKRRAVLKANLWTVDHAPWTIIHHVDVLSYEWIMRRGGKLARKSRLLADPVETSPTMPHAEARRRLGIPEDGRYVGCAGVLDSRKGIDILVSAFADYKFSPDVRLLLAGRLAPNIKHLINHACARLVQEGRIVTIDRYVNKDELHAALCAMDLVVTPYPAHVGLSNIALRAAAAERPILASTFGWLGLIVPRFGLGTTCEVTHLPELARHMKEQLDAAPGYHVPAAAARLLEFHSMANFKACWTEQIRQRLRVPMAEGYRTWDWVNEGLVR